jgi:diadenosine tetraphosphate (Ap4A) HIT family hydrolase
LRQDPKDTIFAKIVEGTVKADKVFEDDKAIAFRDINPQVRGSSLLFPLNLSTSGSHTFIGYSQKAHWWHVRCKT